ncbi:hypothetical protein NTD80_14050 [Pseudomonas sp. 13B_2.1_Bac1]|uniref:hypothetical protein n=1 Tax=Pseudomonas sp. 13B_2.1_Bac1 TaxID=2971624 RepID=UPI0021C9843F|nr:hypothetical protein [Pseudomonas sp. 13B_2.1_Bac1]MCU1783877.1 hypothetical protein [Pseudomonas sp. 13B_2.1_Bac1]
MGTKLSDITKEELQGAKSSTHGPATITITRNGTPELIETQAYGTTSWGGFSKSYDNGDFLAARIDYGTALPSGTYIREFPLLFAYLNDKDGGQYGPGYLKAGKVTVKVEFNGPNFKHDVSVENVTFELNGKTVAVDGNFSVATGD